MKNEEKWNIFCEKWNIFGQINEKWNIYFGSFRPKMKENRKNETFSFIHFPEKRKISRKNETFYRSLRSAKSGTFNPIN